jgi:hypothetical protein
MAALRKHAKEYFAQMQQKEAEQKRKAAEDAMHTIPIIVMMSTINNHPPPSSVVSQGRPSTKLSKKSKLKLNVNGIVCL